MSQNDEANPVPAPQVNTLSETDDQTAQDLLNLAQNGTTETGVDVTNTAVTGAEGQTEAAAEEDYTDIDLVLQGLDAQKQNKQAEIEQPKYGAAHNRINLKQDY
jgi:hypothetical protein